MTLQAKTSALDAVVCIPTFRRPDHLRKTLRSLIQQTGDVRFAVVIVDNDASRTEGETVAREILASGALQGRVVVEPQQGNCHAINRAFRTAMDEYPEVEFFLMIDDDEVAAPDWLSRMLGSASDTGADIVGGPVDRVFDRTPTRGIALHTLFNNVIAESGFVPSLYGSGNCLMRRSVFEKLGSPAFDLRFNFLGGGDMDFFTRARLKGFVSYWDNDARATETVPAARMTAQYVIRRSIATGVINYSIDRRRRPGLFGLALTLAKNLVGIPLAMSRAAALFVATRHWLPASYPLCVSLGRQLAAFGYDPAGYKAPVAAPSGASTAANPA